MVDETMMSTHFADYPDVLTPSQLVKWLEDGGMEPAGQQVVDFEAERTRRASNGRR
ncbi:MAG: hypothetical protein AB7E55_01295 [Pigmentiphaga sp.]